ncbi:spectrin beta chain [Anaeramoeba flamelloides]|uniref:Spectrin beta chain n=1 Tax=Anaeramoeba flamelloides TaxID=1746091 RepID=A0ABQ8X7C2_9EUKA|nr:spectrin beta chain [Anaeramoeba flamelloides]
MTQNNEETSTDFTEEDPVFQKINQMLKILRRKALLKRAQELNLNTYDLNESQCDPEEFRKKITIEVDQLQSDFTASKKSSVDTFQKKESNLNNNNSFGFGRGMGRGTTTNINTNINTGTNTNKSTNTNTNTGLSTSTGRGRAIGRGRGRGRGFKPTKGTGSRGAGGGMYGRKPNQNYSSFGLPQKKNNSLNNQTKSQLNSIFKNPKLPPKNMPNTNTNSNTNTNTSNKKFGKFFGSNKNLSTNTNTNTTTTKSVLPPLKSNPRLTTPRRTTNSRAKRSPISQTRLSGPKRTIKRPQARRRPPTRKRMETKLEVKGLDLKIPKTSGKGGGIKNKMKLISGKMKTKKSNPKSDKQNELQAQKEEMKLLRQEKLQELKAKVVRVFLNNGSWKTLKLETTDTVGKLIEKVRNKTFDIDTSNYVLVERKGRASRILDNEFNAWFIKNKWKSQNDDFCRFVFLDKSSIQQKHLTTTDQFVISKILFEDETHKTLKITKDQVSTDIVKIMCTKIFIDSYDEYSLFVKDLNNPLSLRMCEDNENIYSLIKYWEIMLQNCVLVFKDRDYQQPQEDQVEYEGRMISQSLLSQLQAEKNQVNNTSMFNPNSISQNQSNNEEKEKEKKKKKKFSKFSKFSGKLKGSGGNKEKSKKGNLEGSPVLKIKGDKCGVLKMLDLDSTVEKWNEVYLSLQGNRCFYFLDFQSTSATGNFSLLNAGITKDSKKKMKNAFSIITIRNETFTLGCKNQNELDDWFGGISKNIISTGVKRDPRSMMAQAIKMRAGKSVLSTKVLQSQSQTIQKKAFENWINWRLSTINYTEREVTDLNKDLSDGIILAKLLESITKEPVKVSTRVTFLMQKLDNLNVILSTIKNLGVTLKLVSEEDIMQGRTNSILSLVWAVIYQLASNNISRTQLLEWVRSKVDPFEIRVDDFEASFQSGIVLNALLHVVDSNLPNPNDLDQKNSKQNWDSFANNLQSNFQIPSLYKPMDYSGIPDPRGIMTMVFVIKQEIFQD